MKYKLSSLIIVAFIIVSSIVFLKYYTKKIYENAYSNCKIEYEQKINEMLLSQAKKKINLKNEINIKKELIDNYKEDKFFKMISKLSEVEDKGDIFLNSFIASNKEKSETAAYYLFTILANLEKDNVDINGAPDVDFHDEKTKRFAIEQLIIASEGGILNAQYILGKYYLEGKYVDKNEKLGIKLLKEAEELSNGVIKD